MRFVIFLMLCTLFTGTASAEKQKARVALLLPMTHSDTQIAALAAALFDAANRALFAAAEPRLTLALYDSGETARSAQAALARAIKEKEEKPDLIIGPLFSETTRALLPSIRAAQIPTFALSNDSRLLQSRARANKNQKPAPLWLLGALPEQTIDTLIATARAKGHKDFASLTPANARGDYLQRIFAERVIAHGGTLATQKNYPLDARIVQARIRSLAAYDKRKEAQRQTLSALRQSATQLATYLGLAFERDKPDAIFDALAPYAPEIVAAFHKTRRRETTGALGFDALFIPESGARLLRIAPLLPYFDIETTTENKNPNKNRVQLLGSSFWRDETLTREPVLHGAWFAAPAQETAPTNMPHLAQLTYDMVLIAAQLMRTKENPFAPEQITRAEGFDGRAGKIRFFPDGSNRRALFVYELTKTAPRLLD